MNESAFTGLVLVTKRNSFIIKFIDYSIPSIVLLVVNHHCSQQMIDGTKTSLFDSICILSIIVSYHQFLQRIFGECSIGL